jgi:hypothetical protein
MAKSSYWIQDPNGGAYALVEGAEERDRWTHVQGWGLAEAPRTGDRVHVVHADTGGQAVMPYDAMDPAGYWANNGWAFGSPPAPVDLTKDPALRDQPTPTVTPAEAKSAPATKAETVSPK